MVPRRTFWGFIIAFFLLILEVRFQRVVPRFNLSILLQAPKGHYVELNLTMESSYLTPCIDDEYIEVRDGYNKSANLLGVFCGGNISVVMRSSGQNLWIRKSVHYISRFRGSFANKTLNFTVEPNLDKVAGTQFVIFNQTSSLWCPAQGAPAPFIVWRKNERVVQNSTSVKYQLTITEENTDEYSCEVNGQDDVDKKEIRFVSERCPDPCRCTITVGIIGAATRTECRGKHLQSVPRHLPFSTAKLALDNNQIKELPPGVFNNNTELTTLNLRDNQINQLPFGVFNNNLKLTYLVLDNNQIKELPPGVFNNNTELIELWLNGNELESLPGDLYSQLVKLQLLALDNNQIKKLPRGLLNNNTELVKLWLNGNELESLPGDLFTQLFKLQLLYLGNNQIKELPPGVFNNNTGLILLLLYGNKIKNLTSNAFSQLMKLRWLDLGNNQIKELPPGVFNNNTELIKLWLYGNKIKHLTSNAFFQLIKLKWLQLNDNDLTELQEGLFDGLRALTHL